MWKNLSFFHNVLTGYGYKSYLDMYVHQIDFILKNFTLNQFDQKKLPGNQLFVFPDCVQFLHFSALFGKERCQLQESMHLKRYLIVEMYLFSIMHFTM